MKWAKGANKSRKATSKTGLSNVYSWLEQLTEERVMVEQLTVGGLNRLDREIKLTERVRNDRVAS